MDDEKQNVPKLRFPGFTDPWEQRKLGEVVGATYGGGTPKTEIADYWNGSIPWIQSSNVVDGKLFDINIPKSITAKGLAESAARLVPEKSIAVVTHVGVGKLVYLPFSYATSQDFVSLSQLKVSPIFVCYALYQRLQSELHIVQGSAIKGITKAVLLGKRIDIPHDNEQEKISSFFQRLDSLITLHQRKLDHVKEMKKGLLQKMFPKDGDNVPELRFPGFTDPWEQRKLGDLFVKGGSGGTPTATELSYYNGDIPFLGIADIEGRYIDSTMKSLTEDGINNSAAWIVPSGAICLAMYASVGKVGISRIDLATSQAFYNMLFDDSSLRDFIYTRLNKASDNHEWEPLISTGTQSNLNAAKVKSFDISIPSDEEMGKIGTFFRQLDSLITLHQRKLDHLKDMKKGLLQQMFV